MKYSVTSQVLLGATLSSLTVLAIAAPALQIPNITHGPLIQAPIIQSVNGVLSARVDMVRAGLAGSSDSILYGNLPLYSNPIPAMPGVLPDFPIPQFPLNYAAAYQFTLSDGTVLPAQFPGPTLKLKQGETLNLEINNKLAIPNSAPLPPAPQLTTNFHTHGGIVSPLASSDNIFRTMGTEGSYTTSVVVPAYQASGVNWFHTHMHGNTADQTYAGLAGTLQFGDPIDPWPQYLGKYKEKIMTLTMGLKTESGQGLYLDDLTPNQSVYGITWQKYVNGQFNPVMVMQPGETQVWTFVASVRNGSFNLGITDANGLSPWNSTILAYDGNDTNNQPLPYIQGLPSDYVKNGPMALDPGARITLAVTAPTTPGTYYLVDNLSPKMTPMTTGGKSPTPTAFSLMQIVVEGSPSQEPPPQFTATGEIPDLYSPDIEIDQHRSFVFSRDFNGINEQTGEKGYIQFKINDASFPNGHIVTLQTGQVEEWVLTNTSPIDHPFHLHQNDIAVMSINGSPVNATGQQPGPGGPGGGSSPGTPALNYISLRDTVNIPAGGVTVIRFRVTQLLGKYVFHCHILTHEDLGMMTSVLVDANADQRRIALGGQGNHVRVQGGYGEPLGILSPLPNSWKGGVNAATGNLDADLVQDVVAGPSQRGSKGRVTIYRGTDLTEMKQFIPFPEFSSSGMSLAIGDIDHDGIGEIIVGRVGPGKSLLRIFRADGTLFREFSGTLPGNFPHGINVAAADFNGDNYEDIAIGAGKGREPLVVGLDGYSLGLPEAAIVRKLFDFVALGGHRAGVNLAGGYLAPFTMPAFMANLITTPASGVGTGTASVWNVAGEGGLTMSAMGDMSHAAATTPALVASLTPFSNKHAPIRIVSGRLGKEGQSVLTSWIAANQPVYQSINADGIISTVIPPSLSPTAKVSPGLKRPAKSKLLALAASNRSHTP